MVSVVVHTTRVIESRSTSALYMTSVMHGLALHKDSNDHLKEVRPLFQYMLEGWQGRYYLVGPSCVKECGCLPRGSRRLAPNSGILALWYWSSR